MTTVWFLRYTLALTEPGGVTIPALDAPPPPPATTPADGPAPESTSLDIATDASEPDAVLDTDIDGRPYLPGSSLAGMWRARVAAIAGDQAADALLGRVCGPDQRGDGSVDADPSSLWVMHATLTGPTDPETTFSTAIDRSSGAARTSTLRGVQRLPIGTTLHASVQITDPTDTEKDLVRAALAGWAPLFGRGTATGHGGATITSATEGTLNLTTRADLLTWLRGGGPAMVEAVATEPVDLTTASPTGDDTTLAVTLTLTGPLLIAGSRRTATADGRTTTGPLRDRDGRPIIPASTLKGVLRSRVEYILRSVGLPACPDQRCGNCRPCAWLGHGGGHDSSSTAVGQRSRIRFTTAPIDGAVVRSRAHSPLDRFTGGAARRTRTGPRVYPPGERGGLLHTVDAAETGIATVTLHIDGRLPEPELCTALLRLALDDLNDGLIGIGAHSTRGYGNLTVDVDPATSGLPDRTTSRHRLAAAVTDRKATA